MKEKNKFTPNLKNIKPNFKIRIYNFLKNAIYNEKESYYWDYAKDMKKTERHAIDWQYYPPKTLFEQKTIYDTRTKKDSTIWLIKQENLFKCFLFYDENYNNDIFEKIFGINSADFLEKVKTKAEEKSLIKLESLILSLKCSWEYRENLKDISFKFWNNDNIKNLIYLINAICEILSKKNMKLECRQYKIFNKKLNLLKNSNFWILNEIRNLKESPEKDIDKNYFKVKFLRDFFAHSYDFQKIKDGESYFLKRFFVFSDRFYLVIQKENSDLFTILEYKLEQIVNEFKSLMMDYIK